VKKTHTFKFGELFCGPGGIGLAAKLARVETTDGGVYQFSHVWATDYDEDSCNTYRHNLLSDKPHAVICEDIRHLDLDRLAEIEPNVDVLAFGFPCNDFSLLGERKGMNGRYGPLYKYCVKALKRFRPQWFFAENVGGLNSNDGRALKVILQEFAGEGYVLHPHLYKFEQYGVPQTRHRIVIIGIRSDLNVTFEPPAPTLRNGEFVSVSEALRNIPPEAPNQERTRHARHVVERLKYIGWGENAFDAAERMPERLRLNVQGAKLSNIYRRLHPEKPSYTITGSGGGGTHVYHWDEPRALTNRERARLQTFPDDYFFCGSKESVRRQIGMAVPPKGAQAILEAVLKAFAGVPYESVPSNLRHLLDDATSQVDQIRLALTAGATIDWSRV